MSDANHSAFVPEVNEYFVPYGYFDDLMNIIQSHIFFPVYLVGPSSLGKTTFVEQACARSNRPFVKINLSGATSESQLIGSHRLRDGNMTFHYGPVIQAMRSGAVLFLDEGDQAKPQISMVLQGILEGKHYYIKETSEIVHPECGFNVILAANTKGRGDVTGRYMGAEMQNWANLERYAITFEHGFPPAEVEEQILENRVLSHGFDPEKPWYKHVVDLCMKTAENVRDEAIKSNSEDILTTRRLLFIIDSIVLFGDKKRAMELCFSRFAEQTKNSWLQTAEKIDYYRDLNTELEFLQNKEKREAEEEERRKAAEQAAAQDFDDDDEENPQPW